MNDARMRAAVAAFGLRIECVMPMCGWNGRHYPEIDGRLRRRPCDRCGTRSLRSSVWVAHYPERVVKLLAEHRAGEPVFQ